MVYKIKSIEEVPQRWTIKMIKDVCSPITNFSFSRELLTKVPQKLMYIHYGDIHKSNGMTQLDLNDTEIPYLKDGIIEEKKLNDSKFPYLLDGDIIIADASEDYAGIGIAWEIVNIKNKKVVSGLHTIAMRPKGNQIHIGFGQYLLCNWYVSKELKRRAQGTKVYSITFNLIKNSHLLLPPIDEQKKIADILILWDKAIYKQSQLITQLELRKKGLMQQLLTGKKRLPGFTKKWGKQELGMLCKRITRKNDEGNTNVMTISAQQGFVKQTDFFSKSVASETLDGYYLIDKNEFCYNKSYSNGYPMGAIKRLKEADKAVVTTLYICFSIIDEKTTDIDFLEQLFNLGILNQGLTKIANEGGRAHGLLNVTPKDFFNLELYIPNFEEQKAISKLLVTEDKEIENEHKILDSFKMQKNGLMQQLLTGKKRIIS